MIDWSDAEAQGLRDAVGEELANQLLKGCQVHWMRSFHRIADKVCKIQHPERRKIENEAFKLIAAAIVKVKSQDQVLKLFQCLCGERDIRDVQSLVPGLSAHHISVVCQYSNWSLATHWIRWWTRRPHLRMLCIPFSDMAKSTWDRCPTSTNAVERKNQDSKQSQPVEMKTAFVKVYRMDKTAHLQYIAACEQVRLSYRDTTQSHEKQAAQKRKERRNKKYPQDKQALQGPTDKSTNFASITTSPRPVNENNLLLLRMSFNPNQKNSGTPLSPNLT